jgi:hypothetical protein
LCLGLRNARTPFAAAISIASLAATRRVELLSSAQNRHASAISGGVAANFAAGFGPAGEQDAGRDDLSHARDHPRIAMLAKDEPGYSVGEHHLARAITGVALRRSSNRVPSGGLDRGPRTPSPRNKAVCKDAVCSFAYHRAHRHHLTTAMPPSTGPPQSTQLDAQGNSVQTE